MIGYLAAVWNCRLFWLSLAKLDLRKRYRRSALGLGWALVQPVLTACVLCVIFSGAFKVGFREHFPFVLSGLCFWNFFTTAVNQGCGCIYWSETYIRQHRAPMAIYPLRIVLPAAFHFLVAIVPVLVLVWMLTGVGSLTALLSLPLTFALLLVFGWSVVTICGLVNVYFPDTQQLCDVSLQILFYGTPIIYRPEMLHGRGLGWLVDYNPLAAFIELVRTPVLQGVPPSSAAFVFVAGIVVVVFLLAVLTLATLERRVIFQL